MDELEKLPDYSQFFEAVERLKKIRGEATYWMAREIQAALNYSSWERFNEVVERARQTCESAGVDPESQFHHAVKKVDIGSGAQRESEDWYLSRYACYLIAMSGDSSKKEIARTRRPISPFKRVSKKLPNSSPTTSGACGFADASATTTSS